MHCYLIEVRGKSMTGRWKKWRPYYFGALTKQRAERIKDSDTLITQYRVKKYKRVK